MTGTVRVRIAGGTKDVGFQIVERSRLDRIDMTI